jgi:hypothetical protein
MCLLLSDLAGRSEWRSCDGRFCLKSVHAGCARIERGTALARKYWLLIYRCLLGTCSR